MPTDLIKNSELKQWLSDLKVRIRQSQIKAMIKVNDEMLHLYWDMGHDIVVRQMDAKWGTGFFAQLSKELKTEFPDMKGFSVTNLKYCKYFYQFYSHDNQMRQQFVDTIRPQVEDELQQVENKKNIIRLHVGDELKNDLVFLIPWGHQKCIIDKCKSTHEALFYVQKTIKNGWSRSVLMHFIETNLYKSQGKSINNFDRLLPDIQSDLAKETLKDPYNFDFLTLTENYQEKELEDALIDNITIGLLIVKKKNNIEAQYSIESSSQPIGISEYTFSKLLPENFKSSLPSIEEIERELNKDNPQTP